MAAVPAQPWAVPPRTLTQGLRALYKEGVPGTRLPAFLMVCVVPLSNVCGAEVGSQGSAGGLGLSQELLTCGGPTHPFSVPMGAFSQLLLPTWGKPQKCGRGQTHTVPWGGFRVLSLIHI